MNAQLPALGPIFPELLVIAGALALLLLGAIRGERVAGMVDISAILILLIAAG